MTVGGEKSKLVRFYEGSGTDHAGRSLRQILAWSDGRLESVHDYIQWLFPNRKPSDFNPHAPIVTQDDSDEFRRRPELQGALSMSADRMEAFYDLGSTKPWWVTPSNHNYLRITRVLLSLKDLGLEARALSLFEKLSDVYTVNVDVIPSKTVALWISAIG